MNRHGRSVSGPKAKTLIPRLPKSARVGVVEALITVKDSFSAVNFVDPKTNKFRMTVVRGDNPRRSDSVVDAILC